MADDESSHTWSLHVCNHSHRCMNIHKMFSSGNNVIPDLDLTSLLFIKHRSRHDVEVRTAIWSVLGMSNAFKCFQFTTRQSVIGYHFSSYRPNNLFSLHRGVMLAIVTIYQLADRNTAFCRRVHASSYGSLGTEYERAPFTSNIAIN